MNLFIKATLVALTISSQIGPVALLCISYAIKGRALDAILLGLGNSILKTLYGGFAILGITTLANYNNYAKIIGGVFIFYLGLSNFLNSSKNKIKLQDDQLELGIRAFFTGIFATSFNPMTIIGLISAFSAGNVQIENPSDIITVLIGLFSGSMIWWIFLSFLISIFAKAIPQKCIYYLKILSSLLLIAIGARSTIIGLVKALQTTQPSQVELPH
jgi:threonine/homoserine/homoserine lactone efflux protein